MLNPFQVDIHNQADDEELIKIWRHHRITLVKPIARVLAFAIIPFLLIIFTGLAPFTSPWLFAIFVLLLAIVITVAAYEWVSWYGDVYVLTNYRIIDIAQHGFFDRKLAEASLDRIQDISFEVKGVLQTFFNYGTVVVQTAGAENNVDMDDVAGPQEQAAYLLQQQQLYIENQDKDLTAGQLIDLLSKHGKKLEKLADLEKEERAARTKEQMDKVKSKKGARKKSKPGKT